MEIQIHKKNSLTSKKLIFEGTVGLPLSSSGATASPDNLGVNESDSRFIITHKTVAALNILQAQTRLLEQLQRTSANNNEIEANGK